MVRFVDRMSAHQWDAESSWFAGWPPPRLSRLALVFLSHADLVVLAVDDATGQVVGAAAGMRTPEGRVRVPVLEVHPRWGAALDGELRRRLMTAAGVRGLVDLTAAPGTVARWAVRPPPPPAGPEDEPVA